MSTTEETPHGAPQESTKVCEWCRESIRIDALKCPHCHKWRKNIQEDINKNNRWALHAAGCAILGLVVAFSAVRNGIWCETTHWPESGPYSLKLFLSSFPGWIVLFSIAGSIASVVKADHYGKSAKRKTGGGLHEI